MSNRNPLGEAQRSFFDHSGTTNENGVRALRLTSVRPPAYTVTCVRCGTSWTEPHSRITYATCKNASCGKPLRRDRLEEERQRVRERERRALEEESALADARMRAEVEDYTMPAKRPPVAGNTAPETERQRLARRERRKELEAEERAEREAREKPVRELQAKLDDTHRKIAAMERQRFSDPKVLDVNFWHDPKLVGLEYLAPEGMTEWNMAAFKNFAHNHPEFMVNDYNLGILNNYFSKHGVLMFSTEMLERTYKRMVDCGIRFDAPEPINSDVLPNDTPNYAARPNANLSIAPAKEPETPKTPTYEGFDLETGERRTYTEREVARMSSEQFKKAMQMVARNEMTLPHEGPGPHGRSY